MQNTKRDLTTRSEKPKQQNKHAPKSRHDMVIEEFNTRRNSLGDFRSATLRDLNETRLQRAHQHQHDISMEHAATSPSPGTSPRSTIESPRHSLLDRFTNAKSHGRGSPLTSAISPGLVTDLDAKSRARLPPVITRRDSDGCIAPYRIINGEKCAMPSPKRSTIPASKLYAGQSRVKRSSGVTQVKSVRDLAKELDGKTKIQGFDQPDESKRGEEEEGKATEAKEAKEEKEDEEVKNEEKEGETKQETEILEKGEKNAAIVLQARWRGSRARNPSNSLWAMELRNVGVIGYSGAIQSSFPNAYLLITVRNKWTSQTIFQTICRPNAETNKRSNKGEATMRLFDELLVFPGLDNNCVLCVSLFQERSLQADLFVAQTSVPFAHIRHAVTLGLSVFKLELVCAVKFRHDNTVTGRVWEFAVAPRNKLPAAGALRLSFQTALFAPQENLSGWLWLGTEHEMSQLVQAFQGEQPKDMKKYSKARQRATRLRQNSIELSIPHTNAHDRATSVTTSTSQASVFLDETIEEFHLGLSAREKRMEVASRLTAKLTPTRVRKQILEALSASEAQKELKCAPLDDPDAAFHANANKINPRVGGLTSMLIANGAAANLLEFKLKRPSHSLKKWCPKPTRGTKRIHVRQNGWVWMHSWCSLYDGVLSVFAAYGDARPLIRISITNADLELNGGLPKSESGKEVTVPDAVHKHNAIRGTPSAEHVQSNGPEKSGGVGATAVKSVLKKEMPKNKEEKEGKEKIEPISRSSLFVSSGKKPGKQQLEATAGLPLLIVAESPRIRDFWLTKLLQTFHTLRASGSG